MEINIEGYLSEEEKQRLASEAYRDHVTACLRKDQKDTERVLGNVSHNIVWEQVSETFSMSEEKLTKLLTQKVEEIINDLTSYSVFSGPSAWDRKPTKGWEVLQKVVSNKEELIDQKVNSIVDELTLPEEFNIDLNYEIEQVILKRLFGKES